MKHKIYISIIMFLVISYCITTSSPPRHLSTDRIEELFYENESMFSTASTVLCELLKTSESDILISTRNNYSNASIERIKVKELNDIYFISLDHIYTDDEYNSMHDCVKQLFSFNDINGIYGNKSYIQFSIELYAGYESSIIYTADNNNLTAVFSEIYKQIEFKPNWYAIISCD